MITILSPIADSKYYVGNSIPITWDLGSLSSTLASIDIDYSLDNGLTWNNIGTVTGTQTSLGLTSINADFSGDVYDTNDWVTKDVFGKVFVNNEMLVMTGSPGFGGEFNTNKMGFWNKVPSITGGTDVTIQGKVWSEYNGGSDSESNLIFLYQDSSNHAEFVSERVYAPQEILISARINGYWVFNTINGPGYGYNTGINFSNSSNVYQIVYDNTNKTIDFNYKTSTTAVSWTTITSITADFTGSISGGIGRKQFNANAGITGFADDIVFTYTPEGATPTVGITANDWMPYYGVSEENTALIRISDSGDPSVSAVNSSFSVLTPTDNLLSNFNSGLVTRSILNTANLKTYAKDLLYNKTFTELRQINILPTTASNTALDVYTVTAQHTDWTSRYYGITSFPYSVIVLPEVYDNVIQGFSQFSLSTVSASTVYLTNFDDKYMLNKFRNQTVRIARLFETSTSVTSSITAIPEESTTSNFIDYQSGVIVVQGTEGVTAQSINYSSGVRVTDNQFICIAKSNEFNRTINPSAYGLTGNTVIDDFNVPYVSGVGIYDNDANLLAVAKLSQPIKKSNKIDLIFKVQIDT